MRKELVNKFELLFFQVAFIARVKTYQFILFIKRFKKDIKKFALQFALKFAINISCFDEEARGVHSTSWKSFLKTNKR